MLNQSDFTPQLCVHLKRLVSKADFSPSSFLLYQLLSNNKKAHAQILQHLIKKNRYKTLFIT